MTLREFVKSKLHCSYDDAEDFISRYQYYQAIENAWDIIDNHFDDFIEDFCTHEIDESTLYEIASDVEETKATNIEEIEYRVLQKHLSEYMN